MATDDEAEVLSAELMALLRHYVISYKLGLSKVADLVIAMEDKDIRVDLSAYPEIAVEVQRIKDRRLAPPSEIRGLVIVDEPYMMEHHEDVEAWADYNL